MRCSENILALMPLLTSAVTIPASVLDFTHGSYDLSQVKSLAPSIKSLQRAYPDVFFNSTSLIARKDDNIDEPELDRQQLFQLAAGGLAAVGYWSFGPGSYQVDAALEACRDDSQATGGQCWNKAGSTAVAHVMIAGAGLVGGRQFIHYFWHGGAAGLPAPTKAKRACNTGQQNFPSSITFTGQYGIKVAGKDFCYHPDSGQLGYASSLAAMIVSGLYDPAHYALSAQFTIYEATSKQVLGRFHFEVDSVRTDLCPFEITGGDSCTVTL